MLQLSILNSPPDAVAGNLIRNKFRVRVLSVTTQRMNSFLETPEFQADLRAACRGVITRYGRAQSRYKLIDDLEQDIRLRVHRWAPRFRGSASRRRVLTVIAENLVKDALRYDKGARREHTEVDWDKVDIDSFRRSSGTKRDAADLPILLQECLSKLSDEERHLFVERRVKSRSPAELASELGVSRQTVAKRLKLVVAKLRECIRE